MSSGSIPRSSANQYTLPNKPTVSQPNVYMATTKVFNPEPQNKGFVLPNRTQPVVIIADQFAKTSPKVHI